jgi:hypothetical protein
MCWLSHSYKGIEPRFDPTFTWVQNSYYISFKLESSQSHKKGGRRSTDIFTQVFPKTSCSLGKDEISLSSSFWCTYCEHTYSTKRLFLGKKKRYLMRCFELKTRMNPRLWKPVDVHRKIERKRWYRAGFGEAGLRNRGSELECKAWCRRNVCCLAYSLPLHKQHPWSVKGRTETMSIIHDFFSPSVLPIRIRTSDVSP